MSAGPVFTDKVTMVPAEWANSVTDLVYGVFNQATTVVDARSALGLGTLALQNTNSIAVTGGTLDGTAIGLVNPAAGRFTTSTVTQLTPVLPGHLASKQYVDTQIGNLVTTAISQALASAILAAKVNKSGDTMSGPLVLSGDPVSALQAATKQYVDAVNTSLTTFQTTLRSPNGSTLVGYGSQTVGAALDTLFASPAVKQVASAAELRTVDTTKYTKAYRSGYAAAGDKGAMAYVYVPTATPPADNGGTNISALGGAGYWLGLATSELTAEQFGWPTLKEVAINNAIQAAANMGIGVVRISTPGFINNPIVFPLNFGVVLEGCNQESLITVSPGVAIDAMVTTPNFETLYYAQPQSSTNGAVRDCGLRHIALNGNKANVPAVTNWMKGMGLRCLWLRPILEDVSIWSTPGIGGISVYPSAGITPPGYNFPANLQVDTKIRGVDGLYIHDTNYEGLIWEGPSDTRLNNVFVGWPAGSLDTGNYDATKKSLKFTSGGLVHVAVSNGGVNYSSTTTVTATDPNSGATLPTLEPVIVNGVLSATVTAGGSNYSSSTRVVAVDNTTDKAYGAVCTPTIVGGVITGIQVTGGRGYSASTTFVITDTTGTGATATPVLTNGVIDRVIILTEGYSLTNPTLTITDPNNTGSGAVIAPVIDASCDGLVFNNQGAELGFVHSFNNVNGWAVNFRSDNNGFPRITGQFVMGESSLGDVRIGGHTRYQIAQIDVHTAGTGGGPSQYPALLVRSDRGGVIGNATDYRNNTPQGQPSIVLSGTNNRIDGGTIFGRGVVGDGVVLMGVQNEVRMSVSGVTGAALVTQSANAVSCKATINAAQNQYAWNNKCPQIHSSMIVDLTNQHVGINQFVNISNITGRQWQDCRVMSTDARGIIVGTKDIRFGSADCTLTTTQNIVIAHNCVRAPTANDVLIAVKENFGASMTLESCSFVSSTAPYYNPSNPVIVQGTVTVAVKFKTAGTGTATVQVNII